MIDSESLSRMAEHDERVKMEPVAWADDAVIAGRVGNCASDAAKRYWATGNAFERADAKRYHNPLYTEAQLHAAVAKAKREERERIANAMAARDTGDMTREDMEVRRCVEAIRQISTDDALDAMAKNADELGLNY